MGDIAKLLPEIVKQTAAECQRGLPPVCENRCPFHMDIRDFIARMQRGRFDAAFRIFSNAVLFPGIVSKLCDAPCKEGCLRKDTDDAVELRLLEEAAVAYAVRKKRPASALPLKKQRAVMIGAGISGLACAVKLMQKNYQVSVFEASDRIGGYLWELLSPEDFLEEINSFFRTEDLTGESGVLHLNQKIASIDEVEADAIYVATGTDSLGILQDPEKQKKDMIFWGGGMTGVDPMEALAQGMKAAVEIDFFFRTGRRERKTQEEEKSSCPLNVQNIVPEPKVSTVGSGIYSREEAVSEATRCLRCDCDQCMKSCAVMSYYRKDARQIAGAIDGTIYPAEMHTQHAATRMIASCDQCGICRQDCPQHFDMQQLFIEARREMVRRGEIPPPYSQFWLEDMAHADGEEAAFSRFAPGKDTCSIAFFPGCQLGASDPRYVYETYRRLLEQDPQMGIMTGCCGAPAYWAGEESLSRDSVQRLKERWEKLGRPVLALACSTCKIMLQRLLPEIPLCSVYELDLGQTAGYLPRASVFDPCSAREDHDLQRRIRQLMTLTGCQVIPLKHEGSSALCCSWGGQYSIANPDMAGQILHDRIAMSPEVYVTYCTNCRDSFAGEGKDAVHILDIILGINDRDRRPPTLTQRRRNREAVKRNMLNSFWGEKTMVERKKMKLTMTEELSQRMSRRWITEDDLTAVIDHCEQTGQKLQDQAAGTQIGHLRLGAVTFWVEYRCEQDGYEVIDAYSHRMQIKEDLQWQEK